MIQQSYTSGALSGSAYGIIGLSTLIALCYIIPAIFLIQFLGRKCQVKPLVLVFALIGGFFITGWLAGYANTFFHEWVTARLSSKNFFYRFEDAIMTPLVEEPLKLAAFIFAVYVVPTKSYKGLLLVAITAGLGWFFLYNLRNSWSNYWCCIVSLALHILPRYGASPDMAFTSKTH